MKKITLIACAALVAGLLVSCNNGTAGTVDYNNVTWSGVENSYIVKGTITVVTEEAGAQYNAKDELIYGSGKTLFDDSGNYIGIDNTISSKTTETYTFEPTEAFVTHSESAQNDRNYDSYTVRFDGGDGFYEKVVNSKSEWDEVNSKKKDYTSAELDALKTEKGDDPTVDLIDGESLYIYDINEALYLKSGDKLFEVTADKEKFAAGEDFTLKVTVVTTDWSDENTNYDKDKKQTGRQTSSGKITKTYDLTFTAK